MTHTSKRGRFSRGVGACVIAVCLVSAVGSADTVVRYDTVLGSFHVQLFDTIAPNTVQNFMLYATYYGYYANSIFHRLAHGFVLQGGGIGYNGGFYKIPQGPTVDNEYSILNTRGTIAMAKLGGDPDSATNQYFFNLGDNSSLLNEQNNGGFTVFGEVIGDGMDVVDLLASQPIDNKTGDFFDPNFPDKELPPFEELPLIGYDGVDPNWPPLVEVIYNIVLALPGDCDADGSVDLDDFGILKTNFGSSGDWSSGDFDGDGTVNLDDFGILKINFGTGATPVPEPATATFLLVVAAAALRRRRLT